MTGPTHYRRADGWTACNMGPKRRARRTTAADQATCTECRSALMGGEPLDAAERAELDRLRARYGTGADL